MDELVSPCRKVSIILACEFACLTFYLQVSSSYAVNISSRDILPCETSASLAESKTSSSSPLASSPERTSTCLHLMLLLSGQIPHIHWLGTMLGTQPQDPPPLPDPEPEPDKPDELEEHYLDLHDLTLSPCQKRRKNWTVSGTGEGDLAHLCLVGECTTGETVGDVGGIPSPGTFLGISLSFVWSLWKWKLTDLCSLQWPHYPL